MTTDDSEIMFPTSLVRYLWNLDLLDTGIRTASGMMLSGRSRKSTTDSLQAFALESPLLEPKSLKGQVAQTLPSCDIMLSGLEQSGGVPSTGSGEVQ